MGKKVLPSQSSFLCTVTASSENRARYCLLGPLVYSVTNSQAGQGAASEDGLVNPLPQDTGQTFLGQVENGMVPVLRCTHYSYARCSCGSVSLARGSHQENLSSWASGVRLRNSPAALLEENHSMCRILFVFSLYCMTGSLMYMECALCGRVCGLFSALQRYILLPPPWCLCVLGHYIWERSLALPPPASLLAALTLC